MSWKRGAYSASSMPLAVDWLTSGGALGHSHRTSLIVDLEAARSIASPRICTACITNNVLIMMWCSACPDCWR